MTKPSIERFVSLCLAQAGERYVYGAEVALDADLTGPEKWDCSELVQVCAHQAGGFMPDGSMAQLDYCRSHETDTTIAIALKTRGALLFIHKGSHHHVAVSLGDGRTIEARGRAYGVASFTAGQRGWTHAGLIPSFEYGAGQSDEEGPLAALSDEQQRKLYEDVKALVEMTHKVKNALDEGQLDAVIASQRAIRDELTDLRQRVDQVLAAVQANDDA